MNNRYYNLFEIPYECRRKAFAAAQIDDVVRCMPAYTHAAAKFPPDSPAWPRFLERLRRSVTGDDINRYYTSRNAVFDIDGRLLEIDGEKVL